MPSEELATKTSLAINKTLKKRKTKNGRGNPGQYPEESIGVFDRPV